MRQLLTALICVSIFLPTPEALALFGRRGPMARLLFGPGPEIVGGGRLLRKMFGGSGRGPRCRNGGGGGCRQGRCGNGNQDLFNDQLQVDQFGNTVDQFGNPVQFDELGNAFDVLGNPINQFGDFANQGGCGGGRCGSNGCNSNGFNQLGNGFQQNDFFSQFDQSGVFNPTLNQFGNSSFNGQQFAGDQFNANQAALGGGIVDPTSGQQVVNNGGQSSPAGFNFGTVVGADGNQVDPFSRLGQKPNLVRTRNTFIENGAQVFVGSSPQCRLFKQDRQGRRLPIDPRNEIAIFNFYQNREAALSPLAKCVVDFYRQNFSNTPFFRPKTAQGAGGSTSGTTAGGAHGGAPVQQPGLRETNPNPQSIFSKWKGDFNAETALKATNEHISAATAANASPDKKFNYTIIQQDCVSKSDPDTKIPTNLILFNSKDESGKDQSHLAFVSGEIKEEDKIKEVEAAWKRVTAEPNEAGGGKLRDVEGDPASFYTTFETKGALEHPETQVQLKKIVKNGQEQFMSRYVHKHSSSLPDSRWKLTDKDAPYYCENHVQPKEKVNCDMIGGGWGTLGGTGEINGYFLDRKTNKCEASRDLGTAGGTPPFSTLKECEDTVAAGLCKEPEQQASTVTRVPGGVSESSAPVSGGSTGKVANAADHSKAVFAAKCLDCHGSGSRRPTKFAADGTLLAGNPSLIHTKVNNGSMPQGGEKLLSSDIDAIAEWSGVKKK